MLEEDWVGFCAVSGENKNYLSMIPTIINTLFKNSKVVDKEIRDALVDEKLRSSSDEIDETMEKIRNIEEMVLACKFFNLSELASNALMKLCQTICKKLESVARLVFMKYRKNEEDINPYEHFRALILSRFEIIQKVLELLDEKELDKIEYYIRLYRRYLYLARSMAYNIIMHHNEMPTNRVFPIFKLYPSWLEDILDGSDNSTEGISTDSEDRLKILYFIEHYLPKNLLELITEIVPVESLENKLILIEYTLQEMKCKLSNSINKLSEFIIGKITLNEINTKIKDYLLLFLEEEKLLRIKNRLIKTIAEAIIVGIVLTFVKLFKEIDAKNKVKYPVRYLENFLRKIIIDKHLVEILYNYMLERQGCAVAYNSYLGLLEIDDNNNFQLNLKEINEIDLVVFRPEKIVEIIELSKSRDVHNYVKEKLNRLGDIYSFVWKILMMCDQVSRMPFSDFLISFKITNGKHSESDLNLVREELTYRIHGSKEELAIPVLIRAQHRVINFRKTAIEKDISITDLSNLFNQVNVKE